MGKEPWDEWVSGIWEEMTFDPLPPEKRPARRLGIDWSGKTFSPERFLYYAADGSWLASTACPIPEWDAMIEKGDGEPE